MPEIVVREDELISGIALESLDPYDAFVTFFQEMNGRAMTEDEGNVIRTVINGEKEVAE